MIATRVTDTLEQKLKEAGLTYKVIQTGSSRRIVSSHFDFFDGKRFSFSNLGLLQQVKGDVRRRLCVKNSEFQYVQQYCFKRTEKKAVEIDFNAAYISAAYFLNLLSYETWRRLMDCQKIDRLRILGCLARRASHSIVKEGKERRLENQNNAKLLSAWIAICNAVHRKQHEVSQRFPDEFLFFWCDNFYCTRALPAGEFLPFSVKYKEVKIEERRDCVLIDGRELYIPKRNGLDILTKKV